MQIEKKSKYLRLAALGLFLAIFAVVIFAKLPKGSELVSGRGVPKEREQAPETRSTLVEGPQTPEEEWVLEHADLFPEGKAESALGNAELIHFMYQFGTGDAGSDTDAALSADEISGQIPCLYQWDERWGFHDYGENVVAFSGCGPTCLAMVLAAYRNDPAITPAYLADYAMQKGYYESGVGTRWAFMQEAAEAFGLAGRQVPSSQILEELSDGHPVIVSVGKGHFTENGHFIVLCSLGDGKICVHDPNSKANSEKLWAFEDFKDEIKNAWVYGSDSKDNPESMIIVTGVD